MLLMLFLIGWVLFGYVLGRQITGRHARIRNFHSLPGYYGLYLAIWCALPSLFLLGLWETVSPFIFKQSPTLSESRIYAFWGLIFSGAAVGLFFGARKLRPEFRARIYVDHMIQLFFVLISFLALLTTLGIVFSLVIEAFRFFTLVSPYDFLFGLYWSPQAAVSEDISGTEIINAQAFGAIPLFSGTFLITIIAMGVAIPVGLMAAIYLSEYARKGTRNIIKPLLEGLAGIPTVVYGFFAAIMVAPFIRETGGTLGLHVTSESALAAGLVMGVMLIPFISSLSDDVIHAVPKNLREGALALGSTSSETIRRVVLPTALPGIVGAILLAVSRAIGETMLVVMAVGLTAKLTANPLDSVTTVTVQIVNLLTGDQEFDSPQTLAAYALGFILFLLTFTLNIIALRVRRRFQGGYG
ncbi:MAG: phosphate ABC transporter permease subunit PstC [Alphaproteobacteria bacterium]|jgi:phosphate transport system permease protein|nr:phosphate ABC transporter permease subunit PstC [Alphaproteobacteria bacterium]MBT5390139.1 phosphate ABC transporter permease subunit PstC [Alphaproteobacteria bacterium]MBT5540321.1 phosphate ABC transporter permease subunit PstC [Alphaproteobacteria bacterium]MBT5654457.1 phosphate ABC transporter permease subunit PstC [Alphaproteobacteria bacterium]